MTPTLPPHIALGTTSRAHLPGQFAPPSAARTASDLPAFLALGILAPESFVRDRSGWRARYAHPGTPETLLDVTYESAADALRVNTRWRGIAGPPGEVGRTARRDERDGRSAAWAALLGAAFPNGVPVAWHAVQQRRVESAYGVHYVPRPREWRYVFLPSGLLQRALCVVPVARLRAAVGALRALQADACVLSTVSASLALGVSTVNYLEDRCPDVPGDPATAYVHAWRATGLVPPGMPAIEVNGAGARALTVWRRHYCLDVGWAFCDAERVLAHLHTAGLLAPAGSATAARGAQPPEDRALLLPNAAVREWQAQFFDEARTRRVTHVRAKTAGGEDAGRGPGVPGDALALIEQATASATAAWRTLPADIREALGELPGPTWPPHDVHPSTA